MIAVRVPTLPSLDSSASSASFAPKPSYPTPSWLSNMANANPDQSCPTQNDQQSAPTSNSATTSHEENALRSKTSEPQTGSADGSGQPADHQPHSEGDTKRDLVPAEKSGPLKIDTEGSASLDSLNKEDEPPISVIHAPVDFGKFNQINPSQSSPARSVQAATATVRPGPMGSSSVSTTSTESVFSDVTVTRLVAEDTTPIEKPTQIPPLQTHIPIAPEWTKTPRAQTRKDLGVFSRPGSSLASISEAEDDHADLPTDLSADEDDNTDNRPSFYRDDDEEIRTLQVALTECWTLCNTLAGLSHIHREKIFSKKGNMQQQAWRSCWRLCQNLYAARTETTPMNVRLTLDLCREFCQALFDVRAREDEMADSVLRVSFELNNHLFNTHDRSLPEAFSERTLDFYITLCHRLMKQRSSIAEETGSLLQSCWGLAEMLFSIRQNRRERRQPDEELLSSAIQACWELCDLFRDGWTKIRPERQTPRPAQTTLTQAFQQAQKAYPSVSNTGQTKFFPETPTTIFEDITAESPYEVNAPNIVVLGPGESNAPVSATSTDPKMSARLQQRALTSTYQWPSIKSASSVTTLSTTSSASLDESVRTERSPNDDPNMALVKALFVRAAMRTKRGFSPLSSANMTTSSSLRSLPVFVKSLPEIAFGSQQWQMSLLDNYRQAIANDHTFRTLGIAANPTLLGAEGDETIQRKIRIDTARAVRTIVDGTFGWSWLNDLFRFTFGVYTEDVLEGAK